MAAYADQLRTVKSYGIASGETTRGDCPFCGRRGTFTIAKDSGTLLWYCFSASCDTRGRADDEWSKSDFLAAKVLETKVFSLPDHFVGVKHRPECMKYLADNHCTDAVWDNRIEVMYDPQQHRCVFLIKEDGVICDAVGRTLDRRGYPKWYRYGNTGGGYVVRNLDSTVTPGLSVVVVEDCASACAVSCAADGYGLLGTSLTPAHILHLKGYKHVYIALDPDAVTKAVQMQYRLSAFTSCSVWFIEDDLKYFPPEQIKEKFKELTNV